MLSLVSIYHNKWTVYYYTFLPISHVWIVFIKYLSVKVFKLSNQGDFALSWCCFLAIILTLVMCLLALKKTEYYCFKFELDGESKPEEEEAIQYREAFKVVR